MGNSLFRFGGAKTAVTASISPSPKRLGWRMPAEWERHSRTHMVVPFNNAKVGRSNWWHTNWRHNGVPAQEAHSNVVKAIAQFEPVTVWTNDVTDAATRARIGTVPGVTIKRLDTEDAWVRDYGPTFLVKEEPTMGRKKLGGVWWTFNAWGGIYDPVNEREVAGTILRDAGAEIFRTPDFVLEGGSIHVDGEGTVLTTEECLLNANRNPHLTKPQIEEYLREYLGADKVIWLPRGLTDDHDTNGHVDNFCAFVAPAQVVLAWCDDPSDPQYAISREALQILNTATDAKGRALTVHKLPIPPIMRYTEEYCQEVPCRTVGDRLAASYVNFYVANGVVVMPSFAAPTDAAAQATLQTLFPDRLVVTVDSRELIVGGGNIHCQTQQQPHADG